MDIGQMKQWISVYTSTSTSDSGGLTQTRSLLFESWAHVKPLSQARAFYYGITENYKAYEITLRYRSNLTTKETIEWGTKVLTISSVINTDSDLNEMKVICTEND